MTYDPFDEDLLESAPEEQPFTLNQLIIEYEQGHRFFYDRDLHGLVFDAVSLPEISLSECDLHESDLSHCDLQRAKFREAKLALVDLSNADCSGGDFQDACLSGADMSYGNFEGATFAYATLEDSNLGCADLAGVDFERANLHGADFRSAVIKQTNFYAADLSGVQFDSGCHEIISEILRQAAGKDVQKRMLAGLVLVSKDWCWSEFGHFLSEAGMTDLFAWALGVLEGWECLQDCTQRWKMKLTRMKEHEGEPREPRPPRLPRPQGRREGYNG